MTKSSIEVSASLSGKIREVHVMNCADLESDLDFRYLMMDIVKGTDIDKLIQILCKFNFYQHSAMSDGTHVFRVYIREE